MTKREIEKLADQTWKDFKRKLRKPGGAIRLLKDGFEYDRLRRARGIKRK